MSEQTGFVFFDNKKCIFAAFSFLRSIFSSILNKKSIFLALSFLLLAFNLKAQTWEAGAFAGGSGYIGELNPRNPIKPSGGAVGLFVQRNLTPYASFKLNYNFGTISGADSTSNDEQLRQRNLSFRTHMSEFSLQMEFNFMKYTPGADFNHFSPYVYFGIGAVAFNPTATYKNEEYDLRPLATEGVAYPGVALVIPYGVGMKYNFATSWNIMASLGYRYVHSDYLDDVRGTYPNRANLTPLSAALSDRSGEKTGVYTGVPGTMRGDFRGNDITMFVGFSISFTFLTTNCYY